MLTDYLERLSLINDVQQFLTMGRMALVRIRLTAVEKYKVYNVVLVKILGKQIPPLHCFCSTRRKLSQRRSLDTLTNQKGAKRGPVCLCLFVSALCGWLLTGSGDVSRHTSQGSRAGAGHTLVSAHGQVGERGDEEAAGPQHHAEISVHKLLAVETPADVGGGGPGAAAQIYAASQLLHHGHGLLSEHGHLVWRKDRTERSIKNIETLFFLTSYKSAYKGMFHCLHV